MAAERTDHIASGLDAAMMTRPVAGRGSEEGGKGVTFGPSSSGFINSRSAAGLRKPGADGGAFGVPTAQEALAGRVERGVSRSPAHAAARDYAGVKTPEHIRDALNRMARR